MSIPAKSNEPGAYSYNRLVHANWRTWGLPYGEQDLYADQPEFYHWCSRDGIGSGRQLASGGRAATSFSRAVCHVDDGTRTDVTERFDPRDGYLYGGETWNGPLVANLAEISAQSHGKIESHFVKSDEDSINQAITQALNNLGGQKVNVGQAIAEGRRTYSMLANSSVNLWTLFLAAKRRQWSKVAELLGPGNKPYRKAADNWLQLQYGWKPLLSDIHGAYGILTNLDPKTFTISGSSTNTRTHPVSGETGYAHWSGEITCRGYAKFVAVLDGSYNHLGNTAGLTNPAALAWELLPYSFVVDWFVPVGNVLQAYGDSAGLNFLYGYSGASNNATVSYEHDVDIDTGVSRIRESGSTKVRYFSFHRHAYEGFPRPGIYGIEDPFNASHGANALALYAQASSRR